MKPKSQSYNLLGVTRSRAKMYEYNIPAQYHLKLVREPSQLLSLTIGIIGDYGKFNKKDQRETLIKRYRQNLVFSAQFFDSFVDANLDTSFSDYYLLIGSSAYYLADLPGNAKVLVNRISNKLLELNGEGLDILLIGLLKNNLESIVDFQETIFSMLIENIVSGLTQFYIDGNKGKRILRELNLLCQFAYEHGTDRHVLLADIIRSVVKKFLYNSSWNSLIRYTNLNKEKWSETIQKGTFIKEFWPAQKILGEKDIYKGKSAVIQMPTSAGKTKSLEIIIRSSFFADRTNMAVIVAPFRALCAEIKHSLQSAFINEKVSIDEPSDALQLDFDFLEDFNFEESKLVLIVTPEKFIYILRNSPELVKEIGLFVFDEGHQFDNGIRGVTYELLLSSLKNKVAKDSQIILISAVISNAESIGNWLIEGEKEIISGLDLLPTHRTIAFVNWTTRLGMLQFIKNDAPYEVDFFVPRVIEKTTFPIKGRERIQRVFPEKKDGKDIALYLALKLVGNGSVAIFCGSKLTVKSISENVLAIAERGYDVSSPLKYSEIDEVKKLSYLHSAHFGADSAIAKSSNLGIYSHSGYTPEGLRLAIEYSMQKEKIRFVICTSTLAQGVNLPIRYLMITTFYQAKSKIKTRDFHNLIGRAGRSGMHTEGSIIFTDSELYDTKNNWRDKWKWENAIKMLDPNNSEPCGSTLLSIFDPLYSDDKSFSVAISPLELVKAYVDSPEAILKLPIDFAKEHSASKFSVNGLKEQLDFKLQIISSIESYLMAYWDDFNLGSDEGLIDNFAKETLAYHISDDEKRQQLIDLFRILANNVFEKVPSSEKRLSYGRTLLGVEDLIQIEAWTLENLDSLLKSVNLEELLVNIWPILYQKAPNNIKKLTPSKFAIILTQMWIKGESFFNLFGNLQEEVKYKAGNQLRKLNQEHIIDICQNCFSFGVTLVVGALSEIIKQINDEAYNDLLDDLSLLHKMIKYGLPSQLAIAFYEIGFADRIVANDLANVFDDFSYYRSDIKDQLKLEKHKAFDILSKYPSYFENVLKTIIQE